MNIADFSPEKLTNAIGDLIRHRVTEVDMGVNAVAQVFEKQQPSEFEADAYDSTNTSAAPTEMANQPEPTIETPEISTEIVEEPVATATNMSDHEAEARRMMAQAYGDVEEDEEIQIDSAEAA